MISKEKFVKIINQIQEYEKFLDKVTEYVNFNKMDPLFIPGDIQDMLFLELFGETITNLINDYLYCGEYFIEIEEKEIKTPEELYDYITLRAVPQGEA